MTPRCDIAWSRQLAGISVSALMLWLFAGTVVLAAHAAAGWWVLRERPEPMEAAAEPAAIMIDLAAVPMAPAAVEEQIAPDEVDAEAAEAVEAEPVEEIELAEAVEPVTEPVEAIEPEPVEEVVETPPEEIEPVETVEAVEPDEVEPVEAIEEMVAALDPVEVPLPVLRPEPEKPEVKPEVRPEVRQEKPKEKPRRKPEAKPKPAAPSVEKRRAQVETKQDAPRAAAPQSSSGAAPSISPARWQARVHSHIARRQKRDVVRKAGDTGTSQVRFSIDGSGNVLSAALARSSGNAMLDDEAVSMVRRSSPVPAPPPGVNRTIILPIRFSTR